MLSYHISYNELKKVIRGLDLILKGKETYLDYKGSKEITTLVNQINTLLYNQEKTEEKFRKTQDQLTKIQRWIFLDKLAAGVIHEINNPLDGIINCIQAIKSEHLNNKQKKLYLDLIGEGLFRIETITKRLTGLTRNRQLILEPINIKVLMEKALFFIHYRMTRNRINLINKVKSNLLLIKVDHGAILQVLVNILLNAVESMPNGGILSIKSTIDSNWIKITISDSGFGIPKDNLSKIFEPFFSTKEDSGGMGLGLSICLNIVEQHMGTIEVKSNVGKGSDFIIKLPVHLT